MSAVPFILSVVLMQTSMAAAPIKVGSGTPESCTGAALQDALATAGHRGGGKIRFDCGGGAVTIAPSVPIDISGIGPVLLALPDNTTIDGDGLITLAASSRGTLIYVQPGATAELKDLVVANLVVGSVIFNAGTLTFKNSILRDSGSLYEGPTLSNDGTLVIKDSVLSNNMTLFAVFIWSSGTLTIENSRISDTYIDGSFLNNDGTLTVRNSVFTNGYAEHGNISIWNSGTASIKDSTFAGNRSVGWGGALVNELGAIATVEGSSFSDNDVAALGGAILNSGALTIGHSTFSGNTASSGGAIFNDGSLTIKSTVIKNNGADLHGGGIYVSSGGTLQIKSSDVTGNIPDNIYFAP
jgi:hypothetical protein